MRDVVTIKYKDIETSWCFEYFHKNEVSLT